MAITKKATLILFLLLTGIGFIGCGKKTAQLQSKAVPPDKTLYENAMKYMDKSQFIKARLSLNTLINTYPDSEFTPKAFFEVGNTYYKEGGTESLLQAETQYRDFQLFYPTSELAADALFKIASLNMRLMLEPERDSTHSKKAADELKKFIDKYPDHEFTPIAKIFLKDVEQNQAQSVYKIGDFYHTRKYFKASAARFKQVADNFPEFSSIDEVYFKLGESLEKIEKKEDAAPYYSKILSEYPKSSFSQKAKERLIALNKPLPDVNQALAEQHQKGNPEEGFSFTRPLKDFLAAMGLTGQGDPYAKAIDILKQEKQAQASLAVSKSPTADSKGRETGIDEKDIIISSTISKSAEGSTKDKANSTSTDKSKEDAKKSNKKEDNKRNNPKGS